MKQRVKRLFKCMTKDLDAIVLFNGAEPHLDNTFFYSTGLVEGLFEGSAAVLKPSGSLEIITSRLEKQSASKAEGKINVFETRDQRARLLKKALERYKRIGFNSDELTYAGYRTLKKATKARFVDVSKDIQRARLVKDRKEIGILKEACRIASVAADAIPEMLHSGLKEYEMAAEINHIMQKLGASGPSFTTISSFGPNTAEPHYTCGSARLKKGQFVLADFGASYKRYASDITRTFVFGRATRRQRLMYETVLEVQQLALDELRAGVDGGDVDKKVRSYIDGTEFKGLFIHSTGHSLGLAVHDGGSLSHRVKTPLEEGMVFTVEPGVYIPGYGGVRIEDDVVIRKNGVEVLTSAKKDFLEI